MVNNIKYSFCRYTKVSWKPRES